MIEEPELEDMDEQDEKDGVLDTEHEEDDKELDGEDKEESNGNCLAGLRCPKCRGTGPFEMGVKTSAIMYDSGCDETQNIEWEDSSPCLCRECGFHATVFDFEEERDEGLERDFVVELCRTAYRRTTVRVRATSTHKAKGLALAQAGDLDYAAEKDPEYEVIYASEPQ